MGIYFVKYIRGLFLLLSTIGKKNSYRAENFLIFVQFLASLSNVFLNSLLSMLILEFIFLKNIYVSKYSKYFLQQCQPCTSFQDCTISNLTLIEFAHSINESVPDLDNATITAEFGLWHVAFVAISLSHASEATVGSATFWFAELVPQTAPADITQERLECT